MDILFIFSAKYLFLAPIIIIGVYLLSLPRSAWKKTLMFILPSLIITFVIAILAGHIYYDPRPFVIGHFTPLIPHAADNGFPSDHALLVSAIASVGTYLNRRLGIILWLLAIIVAVSRVYVGVHHPIDVIGSAVISIVVTTIIYLFLKHQHTKSVKEKYHVQE